MCAAKFGVQANEVLAMSRCENVKKARWVACMVLRRMGLSFPDIVQTLGSSSHHMAFNAVAKGWKDKELAGVAREIIVEYRL